MMSENKTGNINNDNNELGLSPYAVSSAILAVLLLIRFLPLFIPEARLWGFNHLVFLPDSYLVVYILLTAIALALLIPRRNHGSKESPVEIISSLFFDTQNKYYYRILFIAVSACMFIVFAAPAHFLGDGYALIKNLGSETGSFYKWSERWITVLLSKIQLILGEKNEQTARTAFQIVSVISGMVSIWFYFLISEIISNNNFKRLVCFAVLFISGVMLLFFGYAENYPLLWVFIGGFIYFGVKRTQSGGGLLAAGIFLLLGLLVHLQTVIFIPAYVFLLFCKGKGYYLYKKLGIWFRVFVGVISSALVILFFYKYNTDLYFRNIFLPLLQGKNSYPEYALLSWKHAIDIINQMILLSPLLPLMIFWSAKNSAKSWKSSQALFTAVIAFFSIIYIFILDPGLGMPRDWDLFSMTAIGLNLFLFSVSFNTDMDLLKRLLPSLILYLIIAVSPFLLVNLNAGHSIKYLEYTNRLDKPRSLSGLLALKEYYRSIENSDGFINTGLLIDAQFPDQRRMAEAFKALDRGNITQAKSIIKSISPDNSSAEYHNLISMLNLVSGNYRQALASSQMATRLRPCDPVFYCNQAMILTSLNRKAEALEVLKKAYRFDNRSPLVLEGLATVYLAMGVPDSVLKYSNKLVETDPLKVVGYYMIAKSFAETGRMDTARIYLNKYIALAKDNADYETKKNELYRLINSGDSHPPEINQGKLEN